MRFVFFFFIISASSVLHARTLDQALLSWPQDRQSHFVDSKLMAEHVSSLWYKQRNRELSQEERLFNLSHQTQNQVGTFSINMRDHEFTTRYLDGKNRLSFIDQEQGLKFQYTNQKVTLGAGNQYQSIAFNHENYFIKVERFKKIRIFNLDIQEELSNPEPGQFIFRNTWEDHTWSISSGIKDFSIKVEQYRVNSDDRRIQLKYQNRHWQQSIEYRNVDINNQSLPLDDTINEYGHLSWSQQGTIWHYSLSTTRNNNWWKFSYVNSDIENRSSGAASLIDVLGLQAALAGANWYYGLKADFKNTGIKLNGGNISSDTSIINDVRWSHSWGISLNKFEPNINSKVYKSIILVGTPNLEEEEQSDIQYLYGSGLDWQSKVSWNRFSFEIKVRQFIPIYTKTIDDELADNDQDNSEASKSSQQHVGYTIGASLSYVF